MGTYSSLNLGKYEIDWCKNEHFNSHACLFQEGDLKSREIEGCEDEREEEWYEQELGSVKDRLELLGYTLDYAKSEHENPPQFSEYEPLPLNFDELLEIISNTDIREVEGTFTEEVKDGRFAPKHIQERIKAERNLSFPFDHWDLSAILENLSPYSQLRVLAESKFNSSVPVVWDFDEIVRNGWVKREQVSHGVSKQFLIVTEGSSDSVIIRKAFDILKPNVKDFFYFVDMQEGYPFTGTGNLYNFVKGLCSIGINNNVIVVFDNDAEGIMAMERCKNLNLPNNIKVIKLPDLQDFNEFPTIGPDGEGLSNINSRAASIECYLDIPRDSKVRWTNYRDKIDSYHGSLVAKDRVKKDFLSQNEKDSNYDYRKIESVLDKIVSECISIRSA